MLGVLAPRPVDVRRPLPVARRLAACVEAREQRADVPLVPGAQQPGVVVRGRQLGVLAVQQEPLARLAPLSNVLLDERLPAARRVDGDRATGASAMRSGSAAGARTRGACGSSPPSFVTAQSWAALPARSRLRPGAARDTAAADAALSGSSAHASAARDRRLVRSVDVRTIGATPGLVYDLEVQRRRRVQGQAGLREQHEELVDWVVDGGLQQGVHSCGRHEPARAGAVDQLISCAAAPVGQLGDRARRAPAAAGGLGAGARTVEQVAPRVAQEVWPAVHIHLRGHRRCCALPRRGAARAPAIAHERLGRRAVPRAGAAPCTAAAARWGLLCARGRTPGTRCQARPSSR